MQVQTRSSSFAPSTGKPVMLHSLAEPANNAYHLRITVIQKKTQKTSILINPTECRIFSPCACIRDRNLPEIMSASESFHICILNPKSLCASFTALAPCLPYLASGSQGELSSHDESKRAKHIPSMIMKLCDYQSKIV